MLSGCQIHAVLTLALVTVVSSSPESSHPDSAVHHSLIEPVPPPGQGIYIWLSSISPTFYGQSSSDFDFQQVGTDFDSAIESAETLSRVFPTANPDGDELMVAFLNATQGGTMTDAEAKDRHWLCNELGPKMAPQTRACEGIEMTAWGREEL